MRDVCQLLSKNSHCSDQEDETHHLIVLDVVALTTGAVLAVWQTEAQSDVVLAIEFLVFGDAHDEMTEAELAHVGTRLSWLDSNSGLAPPPSPATAFHQCGPDRPWNVSSEIRNWFSGSIIMSAGATETNQELYFDAWPPLPSN